MVDTLPNTLAVVDEVTLGHERGDAHALGELWLTR